MEQGKIAKWLKKEGEEIIAGDQLVEIETDKTTMPMEADDEGFIAKILIDAGPDTLQVGTQIAIVVEEQEHITAFEDYDPNKLEEEKSKEPPKPQKQYPPHRAVTLPSLSPTMEQGKIAKWLKAEGDEIISGDNLVEIETDKTTMPMDIDEEGFLAKILTDAGPDALQVGTQIAIIVEDKNLIPEFSDYTPPQKAKKPVAKKVEDKVQAVQVQQPTTTQASTATTPIVKPSKKLPPVPSNVKISPRAKTIANIIDLDYRNLAGTGPGGRIIEQDIKNILKAGGGRPSFEDVPNPIIRKIIAERLVESKTTIPHYYISLDITVDNLLELRGRLNYKSNSKISVNDILIKAAAMSMRHIPEVNSSWQEDYTRVNNQVDVSFACQTAKGLITPIVTKVDTKGLEQIATDVKDLAGRARDGSLQTHEFQGGTFCISNLGMFGIKSFAAIINPPQSAILAVGRAEERCVPINGQVEIKNMLSVTLSCDHRAIDGAVGAQWLQHFKEYCENPEQLLL